MIRAFHWLILFSFLSLLVQHNSMASCQINFYESYIKANNGSNDYILNSDCEPAIKNLVNQKIDSINNEEEINIFTLLAENFNNQIEANLEKIYIFQLPHLISKEFYLNRSLSLSNVKITHPKQIYPLQKNESFTLNCLNCENEGLIDFAITFNSGKKILGNFQKQEYLSAYVAKKNISAFETLSEDSFEKKILPFSHSNNIVQELSSIKFYKANKNINKGKVIQQNDIVPTTLVNRGQTLNVISQTDSITISLKAVAKKSGIYNDIIEVINPKTQKTFNAKIIDFNKVKLEL